MNNSGGTLSFEATIANNQFAKDIASIEKNIKGLVKNVESESSKIDNIFRNLGRTAANYFAFTELAQLPATVSRIRGEFQQLEIAFTTMLGSKAKADKLMAEIVDFAAKTPYGLKDTAAGAKQLLAFGLEADKVRATLTRLGDVASGIGAPLSDIVYLYGTTMTQGRLYTQDLNQFTSRGIPMIKELAKQFGVAEKEVKGLVEAGKVGFPEVQKVIESLTAKGSMFGGLMEEQSKSILGLQAQFSDAVDMMFNDLGRNQEGLIASTIKAGTAVVENYQDVIDVLTVLVSTYGAYRGALIAVSALQALPTAIASVKTFFDLAKSIRSAADAAALFNLTTAASPLGAVLAVVGLAASAYVVYGRELTAAEKAQDRMNEATLESEKALNTEIAKVEVLRKVIGDNTRSVDERNRKLKELVALNPSILGAINLQNVATTQSTKVVDNYIKAKQEQIRVERIQAQIAANLNEVADIRAGKRDDDFKPSLKEGLGLAYGSIYGDMDLAKEGEKIARKNKEEAVKEILDYNKKLSHEINNGIEQRRAMRRRGASAEQKDTEASGNELTGKAKEGEKAKSKAEADGSAERVLTYLEEIEQKKQAYMLYERWIQNYGELAANDQFDKLLKNGQTYIDFITSEIQRLEAVMNADSLTTQEKFDLDNLIAERDYAAGKKSPIEVFTEELDIARDSAGSLTEYLELLKQKQSELAGTGNTFTGSAKRQVLAEQITSTEAELKRNLNQFLTDAQTYAQKRLAIEKRVIEQTKTARRELNGEELSDALKTIEERKKMELEAIADEEQEQTEAYKRVHEEALTLGRRKMRQNLQDIQDLLKAENISIQRRKELEADLSRAKKALNENTVDTLRGAADIISNAFGDASLKFSENMQVSIRQLGSVINSVANLADNSSSKMSKVSSIVDIFSFLTVSVRDALLKQEDLVTGMEPQEEAYQRIANEIEGINILLERQRFLLDQLQGRDKAKGMLSMIDDAAKEQKNALQELKQMQVDVISSQKEVFVDPVWGTEVENKGLKAWYANVVTLGQAKTKIKYEFESVDTTGLETIEDFIRFRAEIAKNGGKINGQIVAEADVKALDALIERYKQAEQLQKDLEQQMSEFLTGTNEAAIADSLVEGFRQGKSAAADFAEGFEDMMRTAILNGLKADLMNKSLTDFYAKFKQYSASDGGLDEQEIAELRADYAAFVLESKKMYDNAEAVTGVDLNNPSSLGRPQQGIAAAMTEETAAIIGGQFNALRIHGAETAMNTMKIELHARNSLLHLYEISQNTYQLHAIRQKMDSVERLLSTDFLRAIGGL